MLIAWMTIVVTACGGGSDGSATSPAATAPLPAAVPTAPPPVRTSSQAPADEPPAATAVPEADSAGPTRPPKSPAAPEPTPAPRLTSAATESQPAPPSGDIRDVDFRNGFVYPITFDETFGVTVADGEFVTGDREDGSFLALYVLSRHERMM